MNIIRKLTSRKFIIAAISVISGLFVIFGADADTVSTVSGGLMVILPTVAYCIAEGRIDAENVKKINSAISDILEGLTEGGKGEIE